MKLSSLITLSNCHHYNSRVDLNRYPPGLCMRCSFDLEDCPSVLTSFRLANSHYLAQKSQLRSTGLWESFLNAPKSGYLISYTLSISKCILSFLISLLHHCPLWGQALSLLDSQCLADSPAHDRYSINTLEVIVRLVNWVIDGLIDYCWEYWVKESHRRLLL